MKKGMLQHRIEIDVAGEPGVVRHRFAAWLQTISYTPKTPTFLSAVTFQRGSVAGNMASIDPRNLICTIDAEFQSIPEGTRVTVAWKVVTAGQLVTRPDIAYWRTEIAEAERVLRGENVDPEVLRAFHAKTLRADMLCTLAFAGSLLVPLAFLPFAMHLFKVLVATGAVASIIVYWILRAPRRL